MMTRAKLASASLAGSVSWKSRVLLTVLASARSETEKRCPKPWSRRSSRSRRLRSELTMPSGEMASGSAGAWKRRARPAGAGVRFRTKSS